MHSFPYPALESVYSTLAPESLFTPLSPPLASGEANFWILFPPWVRGGRGVVQDLSLRTAVETKNSLYLSPSFLSCVFWSAWSGSLNIDFAYTPYKTFKF